MTLAVSSPARSCEAYRPSRREQLVVGADLDDPPRVEDGDAVGVADRREPVGDDDRRAAGQRRSSACLHLHLAVVVEVARRLVEDHHGRILEQEPGDGHPLLLTAREAVAAVADDGVEAVGQGGDRVEDAGGAARLDELLHGRVRPGVAQVVADRVVEQVGVLGDDADRRPQRAQRQVAHVETVDAGRRRRVTS